MTTRRFRRTTTITIRWLLPLCWFKGHDWQDVHAATAFDFSGRACRRCEVFQRCLCFSYDWNGNVRPCVIHPERTAA